VNWLDGVIIALPVGSTVVGVFTGLIKTIIPFFGFVLGLFLAFRLAGPFGRVLGFLPQDVGYWVAFTIVLAVVVVLAAVVANLLSKAVEAAMLGWLDRTLGGVWGLAFGAVLYAAILTLWVSFLGEPDVIGQSPIASFMLDKFGTVVSWLPGEFGAQGFFY